VLEGFAEVPDHRDEPPVLKVSGAIPLPHPNLTWRLTAIEDPTNVLFLSGGKRRCRYETEITLTQHVTADSLNETLRQTKAARGLKTRTTRVKSGEQTLYDVARRYYGDPSRASDIARANFKGGRQLALGSLLTVGRSLRMPA
jgi:nucleoid-associated protein YgaU